MTQESPLASGPDAWNFLQASLADIFLAPYTMRAYRKAMRFIAQSLDEIEQRISRRQSERVPARHKEGLPTPIAIGPLPDCHHPPIHHSNPLGLFRCCFEFPFPAVDQDQVRPWLVFIVP